MSSSTAQLDTESSQSTPPQRELENQIFPPPQIETTDEDYPAFLAQGGFPYLLVANSLLVAVMGVYLSYKILF